MEAMSQEQRQYFVRRLEEMTREKMDKKAQELFGPSGRPQQPTWGEVFAAIKAGEITLKPEMEDYTGPYLNPQDVVWPAMEAKKQELCDYQGVLNAEKQKALDAVMLNEAASDALSKYAAI